MSQRLIIWDFDGVIADSEYLWVQNWTDVLQKNQHIDLSAAQQRYYLEGKAEKTKIDLLRQDYPDLQFDDSFWNDIRKNEDLLIKTELRLTPEVLDVISDENFTGCIATGATPEKHYKKIQQLGLEKYFSADNTFTAYDVTKGKPAPDLFLYAAAKMGYEPQNCIVVEDSLSGIAAGRAAKMTVIAYIGAHGHNNREYAEKCRQAGADFVAPTMREVHEIIRALPKK